jgi:hypothetical protein
MAAGRDEDVRGFDIAMDDSLRVRRIECVRNLDAELDNAVELERMAFDEMFEGLTFEQLHHEELLSFVFADVVDRADVRMVQRGRGTCLALKTLRRRGILRPLQRQELERHVPAEPDILGAVHDAHAAPAELLEDPVVRDGLAEHRM